MIKRICTRWPPQRSIERLAAMGLDPHNSLPTTPFLDKITRAKNGPRHSADLVDLGPIPERAEAAVQSETRLPPYTEPDSPKSAVSDGQGSV
jgi:hypothetical protein